jgi:RNA polymerase sigma factor (sigma-70 family)
MIFNVLFENASRMFKNSLNHSIHQINHFQERYSSKFENLTDVEIWNEFKKGNDSSFLYVYNKYFEILYGFGFQLSKDRDFIKDCIQDLFVELNHHRSRLSEVQSIKAYLMISLKRKILYYQKRSKKFIYKNDLLEGYDFQMAFSQEDKIINQQIEQEKREKLNKAVQSILTKRQREAIYYLYYENLSIDDVADLMKITRRGAQNLLYKAVSLLKSNLSSIIIVMAIAEILS